MSTDAKHVQMSHAEQIAAAPVIENGDNSNALSITNEKGKQKKETRNRRLDSYHNSVIREERAAAVHMHTEIFVMVMDVIGDECHFVTPLISAAKILSGAITDPVRCAVSVVVNLGVHVGKVQKLWWQMRHRILVVCDSPGRWESAVVELSKSFVANARRTEGVDSADVDAVLKAHSRRREGGHGTAHRVPGHEDLWLSCPCQ